MRKSFVKTLLLLCLVLIISFGASCKKKCKNHDYVDGVCSKCEAVDPDYKAPHTHNYVEGVCSCGEKDPNYHVHSYVNGKCECGQLDPNHTHSYVKGECACGAKDPDYHEHAYVNGKCECGAVDPDYKPDHEHVYENGKCECGAVDPSYKQVYTITFNLNGGTLTGAPKEYDGSVKVTLPAPTRDGYDFNGWYENAQFTGSAVSEIAKGSTGNKVFYAKWVEKAATTDGRPWELNRAGFDGQSMNYLIKVLPVAEFDPYDAGYTGTKQALKQAHQADVEDAYNINIVYSAWDNDAQWGPTRVEFIKNSFIDSSFQKKNVFAVNITSQWIPTLVKADCLAELYNYELEEGIFADYEYVQDSTINESVAVRRKVYGYQTGAARPDYFLYYNSTKIASIGMADPAEMWFRGEWTWSNFDKWVRDAQIKLGTGEYAIDCGYAEFIIGAAPAQGAQLINASRGNIMFTKSSVTNIVDKMKAYYKEGFWDTKHGVQDVSTNFKAGKTLIHTGSLWFLKESTRFTPEGEDNGIQFKMGVVPYPLDDNTTVTPITEPYSYEDTEGNLVEVTEPLKTRTNETLTTKTSEPIYGIDLSESNFLIPYTGSSCFSLINYAGEGQNGINTSIAFCILHDLLSDMAPDPADDGLTADDAYRLYLNKKLDYTIDVEAIMSVQDSSLSYYELMEVLSMTVGGGSHFGPNGFWVVASGMMTSEDTPATKLKEIETPYKEALQSLGYN